MKAIDGATTRMSDPRMGYLDRGRPKDRPRMRLTVRCDSPTRLGRCAISAAS
jgi:hypothetical protein